MSEQSFVGRILNRSFYYGFGSVLGRVVGLLMLPIYTNYLTPKDYGVAGFLVFYVSLSQIVLGGKLEQAISKFHFDKNINLPLSTVLTTATFFTFCLASIPCVLSIVFADQISILLFDSSEFTLSVLVISFNIIFGTTELYGLQYLKIVDKPKMYLAVNVLKLLIQLTVNVVTVVLLGMGVLGVVISSALAALFISVMTFIYVRYHAETMKIDLSIVNKLLKFSLPLWVSGLLGLYAGSVYQLFIKYYSGLSDLGLYNLAYTFGGLVATLAWEPFFNFWSVERFRIYELPNAIKSYKIVFYSSAGISLFLSFGISIFSDPVIRIMANSSFHDSILAVPPLTIFTTITYLIWYLNFSFLVTDNNREIAHNGLIYSALITVIFFMTIPKWGFVGAAYGLMVANLINLHIVSYRANKFFNIGISIFIVDIMVGATLLLIWVFTKINKAFDNPFIAAGMSSSIILLIFLLTFSYWIVMYPRQFQIVLKKVKNADVFK